MKSLTFWSLHTTSERKPSNLLTSALQSTLVSDLKSEIDNDQGLSPRRGQETIFVRFQKQEETVGTITVGDPKECWKDDSILDSLSPA